MLYELTLRNGWRVKREDIEPAWKKGFDDSEWEQVSVPHDASIAGPFDPANSSGGGYVPGGVAWYRGRFRLPEDARGRHIELVFDGVYKRARVYVNGYHAGSRASGYTTFGFDITPFARFGDEDNVIAVRAEHIETADSRWFTGMGIYRDVHVRVSEKVHFVRDGARFETLWVKDGEARVFASCEIAGGEACDGGAEALLIRDGEVVCRERKAFSLRKGEVKELRFELTVPDAALWSDETPEMYELCFVTDGGDRLTSRVGIRTIAFDPDRGFSVNGEMRKLKGVCVHHDAGCLGAAVTREVWERRLRKLKTMGCNALRMSHNPMMPALYGLCDEMGFFVMDEAFDEWENGKNKWWQGHNVYPPKNYGYAEDFPEWHERDLRDLVRRDRLHPSVILWSIGNEIDYPNDPYCSRHFLEMTGNNDTGKPKEEMMYDPDKPDASRIPVIARELRDIVRANDVTRPVCAAVAFPELSNLTGYCDVLDVCGYNYKEMHYERDHAANPGRVLLGSENGSGYGAWKYVRDLEYIPGQFVWTGIDYLGEARGWPVHGSPSGFLDEAGFEKAGYYIRKSWWSDETVLRLFARAGGTDMRRLNGFKDIWSFKDGERVQILAASNGANVRVMLNGDELVCVNDREKDGYLLYECDYRAGELRAEDDDGNADVLLTPGGVLHIECLGDEYVPCVGIAHVCVHAVDDNGTRADFTGQVRVSVTGSAALAGLENGDLSDNSSYALNERGMRQGRLMIYVKGSGREGDAVVTVESGIGSASVTLPVR